MGKQYTSPHESKSKNDKLRFENRKLLKDLTRYHSLFLSSEIGLLVEDEFRNIAVINQAYCDIFNCPEAPDKMAGQDYLAVAKNSSSLLADPDWFMQNISEVIGNRQPLTDEGVKFADGRIFRRHFLPLLNDTDGRLLGYMWQYQDISSYIEAEKNIQHQTKLLESLFKNSTDAILLYDQHYRVVDINHNFYSLFGYTVEEITGLDVDDMLDIGKAGSANRDYTEAVLAGKKIVAEGTRYTKTGNPIAVLIKGIPSIIEDKFYGGFAIYTDISDRKKVEEALRSSEERYREILSSMNDGYFEVDLSGNITFCNKSSAHLLGYSVDQFIGVNYRDFCKDHQYVYSAFNQVFRSGKTDHTLVMEIIKKDGSVAFGELSLSLIKDKSGKLLGFRGVGRDVTDRKYYEDQLKYLSLHDQLTGLYNRAFFENELQRLTSSREYPVTIISVDLDGLKLVNDTVGHAVGDQLLIDCANILKETMRKNDTVARVGGDEFVALLPRTDTHTGENIVERIHSRIELYNKTEGNKLPLSISLGFSSSSGKKKSLELTFKEADDLMYRAKLHKGIDARSQILQSLMVTLGERDFITEGHARRLEELCRLVGEMINLSVKQLSDLMLLAQVHDLGKVGIPDRILFKKTELTDSEWEIMHQHPEKGYRIALSSTDLAGIADLILKHHERWDGKGYPLGLKEEEIPVECRILAIADAYDAMTNNRPYRLAVSQEDAVTELKAHAGKQFDPQLVKLFLELLPTDI